MATGIVVRSIAGHLVHKTLDPAVVVCDERGQFATSLVSGHVGGANVLAREVAEVTGGRPEITTATDVNRVPAIDVIAMQAGLAIENPDAIKAVNMALVTGSPIAVHDPHGRIAGQLPHDQLTASAVDDIHHHSAGVFVDHIRLDLPPHVLVLRPGSLVPVWDATGAMRDNQRVTLTTLADLHRAEVDMQATVFIGNSSTLNYDGFMITPRGYVNKCDMG